MLYLRKAMSYSKIVFTNLMHLLNNGTFIIPGLDDGICHIPCRKIEL